MICKSPGREKAKKSPEKNENSPEWMGHVSPLLQERTGRGYKIF